jgi:MobA/MobL family
MAASGHYHCSVKGVGRGSGASVMQKAAYRAGVQLHDARTGAWTADYGKRAHSVIDKFIVTREDAAAWRCDRQRLWNAAEAAEPRVNGRLATELELALPHELTATQRRDLVSAFVRRIVERHGVAADVAIHTAHDDRNIHAHVLLTHRALGPGGFGEIANARTITKKIKGREKPVGIAGIAATPADIIAIRKAWAEAVNRAYAMAGFEIRVDYRSHEERGIRDAPTIHLGPKATGMERKQPGSSDRGDINREIERLNAYRRKMRQARAAARHQAQETGNTGGQVAVRKSAVEAVEAHAAPAASFAAGQAMPALTGQQRALEQVFSSCGDVSENLDAPRSAATAPAAVDAREPDTGLCRQSRGGQIRRLFHEAVKAVTQRATGPPPNRRRRREETSGAFRKLARKFSRRFADLRQDFKARTAITGRGIRIDPAAYERATGYLSDTLDQLNQLNNDGSFTDSYDNSQNNISPML